MDLSCFVVADLNVLVRSRLYLQLPGLANCIVNQFAKVAIPSDRLGDTEFWTFLLGDEADDFFDSQPTKRAGDECSSSPKRAAVETQDGGAVTRSAAADSGHPNGPLQGPT
ncbi:MAG: hypothetical protein GY737_07715, partial [Desulfobacteraceae bacterium]|nr:hypothetical protein [Desulfobacteraceae bacterium]